MKPADRKRALRRIRPWRQWEVVVHFGGWPTDALARAFAAHLQAVTGKMCRAQAVRRKP